HRDGAATAHQGSPYSMISRTHLLKQQCVHKTGHSPRIFNDSCLRLQNNALALGRRKLHGFCKPTLTQVVFTIRKVETLKIRMIEVAHARFTRGIIKLTNFRISLISDAHHSRDHVGYLLPAAA
ncbi:hypothetical protein, partial [Corynebacterium casei]|uniref:hypothetical protein n=1 Tax=Corynebacterium casei TaxID=160386 RepID=UPI003FD636F6